VDDEEVRTVQELKDALPRPGQPFRLVVKSRGRLYQFQVSG